MKLDAGRLHALNDLEINPLGSYVLYWMEASQRTRYNHALEFAVAEANRLDLPTVVLFCLVPDYPESNLRHFRFLLDGIHDVAAGLAERDVRFCVVSGQIPRTLDPVIGDAALVVTDRGYLRHQRLWRKQVGMMADCRGYSGCTIDLGRSGRSSGRCGT